MGNRCVITTNENIPNDKKIGIYLHWNGGKSSVKAFLTYCKLAGVRNPINDNYGWARMCQVIGNFFGGTLSIGIDTLVNLDCDNGDNGMYLFDKDWNIVQHLYSDYEDPDDYDLLGFLYEIDDRMPILDRIGQETIKQMIGDNK